MDPITLGIAAFGFATSAFGMFGQSSAAKASAQASKNIAGLEIQQDAVRRQAMEVSGRRQQMEVLRNQQRARSLSLNNATSQGAQFGSGLQGGYGQVSGQSGVNLLGINQGLMAGRQMFDLNAQVDQQKMNIADAQSQMATSSGIYALGKAIGGSAGPLGNIFAGFGGGGSGSSFGQSGGGAFTTGAP